MRLRTHYIYGIDYQFCCLVLMSYAPLHHTAYLYLFFIRRQAVELFMHDRKYLLGISVLVNSSLSYVE